MEGLSVGRWFDDFKKFNLVLFLFYGEYFLCICYVFIWVEFFLDFIL